MKQNDYDMLRALIERGRRTGISKYELLNILEEHLNSVTVERDASLAWRERLRVPSLKELEELDAARSR